MKHVRINTAKPDLFTLARRIMADDWSLLPKVNHEHFSKDEWRNAAEYALECDDDSELEWMLSFEADHSRWIDRGRPVEDEPAAAFLSRLPDLMVGVGA